MRLPKLAIGLAAVIMCGGSAAAEPITVTYQITLTSRTEIFGAEPTIVTDSFEQQFLLALTFDSSRQGAGYGAPEFSSIPLPVVLEPEGLSLTPFAFTIHGLVAPPDVLGAVAEQSVAGVDDEVFYARSVRLERIGISGPFTAAEFPIHLNSGTFSFREAFSLATGEESRSITYVGTANLSDPSVVPEPTTMLLGGSGLALILAKARRRRSKARGSRAV
jgi:hypothetical protein